MTLNLYAYAGNNPQKYVDPSGHCFWDACIAEGIAVGAIAGVAAAAAIGAGVALGKALDDAGVNIFSRSKSKEKDIAVPISTSTTSERNNDNRMILYHATSYDGGLSILENGIDLQAGRTNLDFGQGFYVTNDYQQAVDWINNKYDGQGLILVFNVSEAEFNEFNGLVFNGPTEEWKELVTQNRQGTGVPVSYDYIEGPYVSNPRAVSKGKSPISAGHQIAILSSRMSTWLFSGFSGYIPIGYDAYIDYD